MNGYICFYSGKKIEVEANTTYGAQQLAAKKLGVPEKLRYKITVMLAQKNGAQYVHSTAGL